MGSRNTRKNNNLTKDLPSEENICGASTSNLIENSGDGLHNQNQVMQQVPIGSSINQVRAENLDNPDPVLNFQPENHIRTNEFLNNVLPEFSGNDNESVQNFRTVVEHFQALVPADEMIWKLALFQKVKGKAREWLYAQPNFAVMTTNEILANLTTIFGIQESRFEKMEKFRRRRWKHEENFVAYYQSKITLATSLNLSPLETVDYLIEGIPDNRLRNQAKMHNFQNPLQLVESFKKIRLQNFKKQENFIDQERRPLQFRTNDRQRQNQRTETNFQRNQNQGSTVGVIVEGENIEEGQDGLVKIIFRRTKLISKALLDSGSKASLIRFSKIDHKFLKKDIPCGKFKGIGGASVKALGYYIDDFLIQNINFRIRFAVIPDEDMPYDVLLGRDFIMNPNILIKINNGIVISKIEKFDELISNSNSLMHCENNNVCYMKTENFEKIIENTGNLSHENMKKFLLLLKTNYFDVPKNSQPENMYEMQIKIKNEDPFHFKPRRLSSSEKDFVRNTNLKISRLLIVI